MSLFGVLPRLLDFLDICFAHPGCSVASCIQDSLVKWRWQSLRIVCIRHAVDAVAPVIRRFKRKRDQGIDIRSLYERWSDIRLGDVVEIGNEKFVIAITICGITIEERAKECTRHLLVHVDLQLYIARNDSEPRDHSPTPRLPTPVLHRLHD